MTALPRDYDSDPQRFLADSTRPHDDVHPAVAGRFAATGARHVLDVGGGSGRLARLLPGLCIRCVVILSTAGEAVDFLRCHGMSDDAAREALPG